MMHSSDHRIVASHYSLKWVSTKKIESNRRIFSLHNRDRFLGALPAFGHRNRSTISNPSVLWGFCAALRLQPSPVAAAQPHDCFECEECRQQVVDI